MSTPQFALATLLSLTAARARHVRTLDQRAFRDTASAATPKGL